MIRAILPTRSDRKEFLRRAGFGSALAAFPLVHAGRAPAATSVFGRPIYFHYYALSKGATVGGVFHAVAMSGSGRITHNRAVGSGSYAHFDFGAPVPKPVLSTGTWRATRLRELRLIGTWGDLAAGVLNLEIELRQDAPAPAVIPATLEVVANIGSADLFVPGKDVGFTLTIPSVDYGPFTSFGAFPRAQGLAVFSVGREV